MRACQNLRPCTNTRASTDSRPSGMCWSSSMLSSACMWAIKKCSCRRTGMSEGAAVSLEKYVPGVG